MGLDLKLNMLPFPPRFQAQDYLEINPLGTVPMLVDGDVKLTESSAITLYLAQKYGGEDFLVPSDHPDYGVMLDYLHHADATLTFPQTVYMRYALFEKHKGLEDAGEGYARWFEKRLIKVENRLDGRDFLCGDKFTVADICVGYALYLSTQVGLSDRLTPRAKAYLARLIERHGFKLAIEMEARSHL